MNVNIWYRNNQHLAPIVIVFHVKAVLYHLYPLTGGKGVSRFMAFLCTANHDDKQVDFAQCVSDSGKMAVVKWLKSSNKKTGWQWFSCPVRGLN